MDTILINGVTYYKLDTLYPGDIRKGCSLKTEDIDQNFHILRGNDIESFSINENTLTLRRLNGNELSVNINDTAHITSDNLTFDYDPKNGSLKITYPDGEESIISGFTTSLYTDNTLTGNGSINNPLKISTTEKAGSFAPVNEFIELAQNDTLPTEGINIGYRILTYEIKNIFGKLYNKNAVNIISEYLSDFGSEWRVPTKEDWDKLLNSLEPSDYLEQGFLPHSSTTIDYLGKNAAQQLKSEYFKYNENPMDEDGTCGYNTLGFNIIPVGIGITDEYEVIHINGLLESSYFWTNDQYENGKYVKGFLYDTNKVEQNSYNEQFASIRLVKDYNGSNYFGDETIFGQTYNTILDSTNSTVWMSLNLNVSKLGDSLIKGINYIDTKTDGFINLDYAYYINEFNGTEWIKKELKEGESIVILSLDEEDGIRDYYRKWTVKDNELKSYENYANGKIYELTETLNYLLNSGLEEIIKNTVKSYIEGTLNEIKITETENGKLKIGFDNN